MTKMKQPFQKFCFISLNFCNYPFLPGLVNSKFLLVVIFFAFFLCVLSLVFIPNVFFRPLDFIGGLFFKGFHEILKYL